MYFELALIGLVISLVYIELTGIYPGGLIIPSYLVLFVNQPERIATTLMIAILAVFIYRFLSKHLLIFGKRRIVIFILIGAVLSQLFIYIFPWTNSLSVEFRIIGWVIPGLIANNSEKQGITITFSSLILVIILTFFAGKFYSVLV